MSCPWRFLGGASAVTRGPRVVDGCMPRLATLGQAWPGFTEHGEALIEMATPTCADLCHALPGKKDDPKLQHTQEVRICEPQIHEFGGAKW